MGGLRDVVVPAVRDRVNGKAFAEAILSVQKTSAMSISTPPCGGLRGLRALAWSVLVVTVASCAEDPRVARRATAIDLAGVWDERRDDEPPTARVTIVNEADVNDVMVTMNGRVIDAVETGLIDRVVDADVRLAVRRALTLGGGRDAVLEETDGGENVSFDLGQTSTLQVVSEPVSIDPSASTTTAATLTWSLRLVGTADELTGTLSAHVTERLVRPGDVDGSALSTTTSTVELRLGR